MEREAPSANTLSANTLSANTMRRHGGGKRVLDLLIGGVCLLLLSPVMLLIAALVRLGSPGPALFRQTRIGQNERPFQMYKFRTMYTGCSDQRHREYVTHLMNGGVRAQHGLLYKLDDDPRVTRLGSFLRRTSLDELPQLFNVLRGEMSLVGPRPMLPWELELLRPEHRRRFAVPAGMTGLWQVSGRSKMTMSQALDLDVEYVDRGGTWLDLRILATTARIVLMQRGDAR